MLRGAVSRLARAGRVMGLPLAPQATAHHGVEPPLAQPGTEERLALR